MGRIEPKEWEEAMIQKYYLRLENPLVSGRWELNPLSSPWQGDILPVNYARTSESIANIRLEMNPSQKIKDCTC